MNWSSDWSIIDTKPTLAEQLREQNEAVDKQIKIHSMDDTINENDIISYGVELTIPIKNGWDTATIKAIQVGDLAIGFSDIEEIGLVTHVPTLTRFDNAIPDGEWTQEQLIKWCWKVQQEFDYQMHWETMREFDNSNYKEISKEFLNSLQRMCLSIPVD